ncbi:hypothetical protein [Pseudomonas sp. TH31]|uniref:hypothetical protein n=1 Tax=Pseudomonas sp. TH31 TaxID=2796396 RepID=UPI00191480B1|nr:hypothetical protein [Pseudomonas sp. TH31]MBK5416398.1 hypothetical protein [Pseudomonas sp. TH31]
MPEETVLIQPQPIHRDDTGCWTHPAWPSTDDELIPYAWFTERGLEVRERNFEGDAPEELQAAWFASGIANCSAWEPTPPAGDGWLIFSIHDTEDGPICIWVRYVASLQREVNAVAAGKEFCGACGDGCGSYKVAEESPKVTQ